jgi:hypothetical protein
MIASGYKDHNIIIITISQKSKNTMLIRVKLMIKVGVASICLSFEWGGKGHAGVSAEHRVMMH